MIVPSDQKNLPLQHFNSLPLGSIHKKYYDNVLKYEPPNRIFNKLSAAFYHYEEFEEIAKFYPNQKAIEATKLEYKT